MKNSILRPALYMVVLPIVLILSLSCEEYLSVKPDKKLAVPTNADDLYAMLDLAPIMNYGYTPSGLAEMAADDALLSLPNWTSITSEVNRATYIWQTIPVDAGYWVRPYAKIAVANTVLDLVDEVNYENHSQRAELTGIARFFRGYTLLGLAQVFCPAYDKSSAAQSPGLVLKVDADINTRSRRASLADTYDQIIDDLVAASELLPSNKSMFPTRPYRAAAFAALARCQLIMGNYHEAERFSDSCLALQNTLMDFNDIEIENPYPFQRFNDEVIFYAQLSTSGGLLAENRLRVDSILYDSYRSADLRKTAYFTRMADGLYAFKGDYAQNTNTEKFCGLTTAEVILTRAESSARLGNLEAAAQDLTHFVKNRYTQGFEPKGLLEMVQDDLISFVLNERRKELIFRGVRWSDLRRTKQTGHPQRDLLRILGDQTYRISADKINAFAYLLPEMVIERSGINQN